MTYWNYNNRHDDTDYDYSKDLDINVDVALSFDFEVSLDIYKDIDVSTEVFTLIEGNTASAEFTVEAIGEDTFAEATVNVLAIEDELSSVDGVLFAAVG